MGLTLIQAPAAEPVSLAEAKLHLRVDVNDDDALISALIVAAREQAEHLTGRVLVTQRWRLTLEAFPVDGVELPKPKLQSVQEISYLDPDGDRRPLDAADYQAITDELIGSVVPAYGKSWPACRRAPGSVVIDFTAGYGAAAAVPSNIKAWMKLAIGTWYAQRETIMQGTLVRELPRAVWDGLLDAYLIVKVV